MKRAAILGVAVACVAILQALPFGHERSNPPVTAPVRWSSPRAEALARRACYDCHSNETRWPWYSRVAPASWFVTDHVKEGRTYLNLSAFDPSDERMAQSAGHAAEEVEHGQMPLREYKWLHPEARLSVEENALLVEELRAVFADYRGRPRDDRPARDRFEAAP